MVLGAIFSCMGQSWKKLPIGQKWSKRAFILFKKIKLLVLSGIVVKRKFLWSFNILQKLHDWEKSSSKVMAKNGSQPK